MPSNVYLKGITKTFKNVTAVDNLSLRIGEGKFVSILGPSGCGKTTTLRVIAGLTQPDSGQVFIGDKDVSNIAIYKRNIGMVFQDYALFPHMNIRDNISFGLRMKGMAKKEAYVKAEDMLNLVKLEGYGDRRPSQISGGQQQRVALARALAFDPSLLLLDEPLSNLDLKLRQEMRVELRRIQKKIGITAIFVTHDQGEALSLSDTVVVMNKGKIEQVGSPLQLYEKPDTRFVASFLGDANFFEGKVKDGLIDCNGLLLDPENKDLLKEGYPATALVRPEKISMTEGTNQGVNRLAGIVESYTYLGAVTRYYILVNGKTILVDSSMTRVLKEQTKVEILWSSEDCIAVKEGSQFAN